MAQLLVFENADEYMRFREHQDESRRIRRAFEEIDRDDPSAEAIEFLKRKFPSGGP